MGLFRRKKDKEQKVEVDSEEVKNEEISEESNEDLSFKNDIKIEMVDKNDISEKELIEVKDNNLREIISEFFIKNDLISDFSKSKKDDEILYKVVIPPGAKLVNSKEVEGAARGFYTENGKIVGHANLVEANESKGLVSSLVGLKAIVVKAAMYISMKQISYKLDSITRNIDYVVTIEESKFKAKFEHIVYELKRMIDNEEDILNKDEVRIQEITNIKNIHNDCCELIGQVNNLLENESSIYNKYSVFMEELTKAHNNFIYQQQLISLLSNIDEMNYTLNLGNITKKNCCYIFNEYVSKCNNINEKYIESLNNNLEKFEIDIDNKNRGRFNFLGKFQAPLKKLVSKSATKKNIDDKVIELIESNYELSTIKYSIDDKELLEDSTNIIFKDDKIYFLNECIQ